MTSSVTASPQPVARSAGALYLLLALVGPFALMFVPSKTFIPGDAAATVQAIQASESLFRAGLLGESVIFLAEVALTALLYVLLRPVSKPLALIAAFARLAMATTQGINLFNSLAVLTLVQGGPLAAGLAPNQLHSLVMLFMTLHTDGALLGQAFFSLHTVILGILLLKAQFLPKTLGWLFLVASVGYGLPYLDMLLLPGGSKALSTISGVLLVPGVAGELWLTLYLLIKGVKVDRWREWAAASA